MTNELNKGDLVLVKWYGRYEYKDNKLVVNYSVAKYSDDTETRTVGFIMDNDKKAIILATSIHHRLSKSEVDLAEGIITIPKSVVIEITKLVS